MPWPEEWVVLMKLEMPAAVVKDSGMKSERLGHLRYLLQRHIQIDSRRCYQVFRCHLLSALPQLRHRLILKGRRGRRLLFDQFVNLLDRFLFLLAGKDMLVPMHDRASLRVGECTSAFEDRAQSVLILLGDWIELVVETANA